MKKIEIFIFLCLLSTGIVSAQNGNTKVIYPTSFGISKPLSSLFEKEESKKNEDYKDSGDKKNRKVRRYMYKASDGREYGNDPSRIQTEMGTRALSAPIANYVGQTGGSCPLDPTGAVGTNHYIQAVNASPFKIFNKTTGATVGTVRNIGSLWSPATANAGDPIVMYDKYADRWFISQFGDPQQVYIAISTTNDPTGTYYTYNFTMPAFTDYLKFSIWADGYYMTSNGTSFVNVFERNAMLTGSPSARVLTQNILNPSDTGFWCPLPGDADGVLPPLGTPCPLAYYTDNGWGTGNIDAVNVHSMTTNWSTTTPSLNVSAATSLPLTAFDTQYDPNWNDVTQGTGTQKLDAIGGAAMYRSQWRKWTGYNTLLLCWAVKIADGIYSTKWVEMRQNQTTDVWSLYQEGTYAPDALSRWIASIAMDDNGSIGLSYLCAGKIAPSTNVSPGLRYTGRLKTDPLGQMTFAEQIAVAGSGASPNGCGVRVGDYAHTSLDPDGLTFWHTGQYFNGGSKTRVYSYRITGVLGVNDFNIESLFSVYQSGENLIVNASLLSSDKEVVVDIFDGTGKYIKGTIVKPFDDKINVSSDVTALTPGIYLVRIGNLDFQKVIKVVIK
jgi:hypothetical protein